MGEREDTIFVTGCPSIDVLVENDLALPADIFARNRGVGADLDVSKPYVMVLQHPVTTEYGEGLTQIEATLKAVDRVGRQGMQVIWLWPNADAGSDDVAKGLRVFRENNNPTYLHLYRNFSPEDYARLLNNAVCMIGNSSSGLREAAFLGTPSVNIGSRQRGRDRARNVIDVPHNADDIYRAIERQIANGRYPRSLMFGDGSSGKRIADILATAPLRLEKTLSYLDDGGRAAVGQIAQHAWLTGRTGNDPQRALDGHHSGSRRLKGCAQEESLSDRRRDTGRARHPSRP